MLIWRALRRLLALIIRLLVINPVVTLGLVGLLIVGLVGVPLVTSFFFRESPAPQASGRVGGASSEAALRSAGGAAGAGRAVLAPAPAVQSYIDGMTEFNAGLMWNALSTEAIAQMQTRGGSLEKLQQGLDEMKRAGARYVEVSYIGGYSLRNGGLYFFYVMTRRGFTEGNALDQVYFVFTVGPDGKIARID